MVSKFLLISFLCLSLSHGSRDHSEPLGATDGPWTYLGLSGYSGLVTMNMNTRSSIFYWLFGAIGGNITSPSDTFPLIIWLQGGPGCSGETGMLWENISPLTVDPSSPNVFDTNLNYTWATEAHLMTIDFPYGTGYSFAKTDGEMKNNTIDATNYLYRFLVKLATKYPTWLNRSVYIFGESYGGHWVPGLAYNILLNNPLYPPNLQINLKGIGLGDPWVDPMTQL